MVCHDTLLREQPIVPTGVPSSASPKVAATTQDMDDQIPNIVDERPQVYHGPFSECDCQGCLEDAKKEAEKRFDSNNLAFGYIKKLENLVNQLQIATNEDYDDDTPPKVYRDGRMRLPDSVEPVRAPFDFNRFAGPFDPSPTLNDPTGGGPKIQIKRMKKSYNQYGDIKLERDRTIPSAPTSVDLSQEYVLSVFREYDRKRNYWRRTLEIRSPPFNELLRLLAYPSVDLPVFDDMVRFKEPLMPLFHTRTRLLEWLKSADLDFPNFAPGQAREHTKLILDFLENEYQDIVKVQNDLDACVTSSVIAYEHLWLVYAPGTVVFSKENGEYEAFVIESLRGCQRHQPSFNSRFTHSTLQITCWSINYDGEVFGRVWSNHYIAPFEGSKEISSLDLVPEGFIRDKESIKQSLVERGSQFWALQGQCFREYTGEVWSSHMNEDPIRVMVDHLSYQRRMNWPIEIDRKRGPANAQSKNWRENRFSRRREPHDHAPPRHVHPRLPPPNRVIYAHGDDRDYSPDRNNDDQREESYERVDCDRPPQADKADFKKFDSLEPGTEPDDMVKLLCPQLVHGYCLRDKVWSEWIPSYAGRSRCEN
ncbi:MAG: hypothetical protein Q9178_001841 [Gyalolechia marmorata]